MEEGILIVSFGTTYEQTREKSIENIVRAVRGLYPDCLVCQAYSSKIVRKVLKERDHLIILDVKEALMQMRDQGIQKVTVFPTHIIDGIENHRMKQAVEECRGFFAQIKVADALLTTEEDYKKTAAALWSAVEKIAGTSPVIFMGHGSAHEADESYGRLERELNRCADNDIYIATVEGAVDIDSVLPRLLASKQKEGRVLLVPFLLVAGDHVTHDMAGKKDSFAMKLKEAGYEPECVLKGIGEYESIRQIYYEHLKRA